MNNSKGFSLIQLIMLIVILGILSAIAIPRYIDLTSKAKDAARDGALGAIRSAVVMEYANRISNNITPVYPATIVGTMFAEGTVPNNPWSSSNSNSVAVSGRDDTGGWAYYPTTGTVESNESGH